VFLLDTALYIRANKDADMAYNSIIVDTSGAVAVIKFNRPQSLNGLTTAMIDEMNQALDSILAPDSGVRCLLLTGEGRAFSSGADLSSDSVGGGEASDTNDIGRVLETHFNPMFDRLMKMRIPFVTAVNGAAAGAGCSFAISGDIVVAAKSAYFLQAFVNIGLVPDVGSTWLLPRLIGKARAQAMMMLGEKIPAQTALDWGMIYKVTDDEDLMPSAMSIAQKLANGPTTSIGLIRKQMRASFENSLTQQLRLEREDQQTAGLTRDFIEGVAAFREKRAAKFTGQ
jgi:2-(1,2-epoxy-1,2-dihydrophenyl)acetyl-CoA isomerase